MPQSRFLPKLSSSNLDRTLGDSAALQKDASDMEQRLHRLKKQIEEERAKRRQRMADTPVEGHLWAASAAKRVPNQLHNISGQGNITRDTSKLLQRRKSILPELPTSPRSPPSPPMPRSASQLPRRALPPKATPTHSTAETAATARSSTRASSDHDGPQPARMASAIPSHQIVSARQSSEQQGPEHSKTASHKTTADDRPVHAPDCGSDKGQLLKEGQFDEAESRASFLAALAEWRAGGSKAVGNSDVSTGSTAPVDRCDGSTATARGAAQQASAMASTAGNQTGHAKHSAQAATSTKPGSLFAHIASRRHASAAAQAAAQRSQCSLVPCSSAVQDPEQPSASAGHHDTSLEQHFDTKSHMSEQEFSRSHCGNQEGALRSHTGSDDRLGDASNWLLGAQDEPCSVHSSSPGHGADVIGVHAEVDATCEDAVLSIEDVNPFEALTSQARLPDKIVLPGQA
jgi:hypothetical protein